MANAVALSRDEGQKGFVLRGSGWSRRVLDAGISEGNTDAAHGVRSHKGRYRGVGTTSQRLQGYCCWFRMEVHVIEFVKQCPHCMNSKAVEKIPQQMGEIMWEPLAIIWDGAPQFVKSELRKLSLGRGVRSRLKKIHGVTLHLLVPSSSSSSFGLLFGSKRSFGGAVE